LIKLQLNIERGEACRSLTTQPELQQALGAEIKSRAAWSGWHRVINPSPAIAIMNMQG